MKRFITAVILFLVLSLSAPAFADTVMTAPDGTPLCFGQTIVNCKLNLDQPNFTYHCVLMGMYNGVPLIAPIEQSNPEIKDRLFMVTLTNSTSQEKDATCAYNAKFDFIDRNTIKIEGRPLANYMLSHISSTKKAFDLPAGRAIQWQNNQFATEDSRYNQLLLTNQFSSGGFDAFDIQTYGQKDFPQIKAVFRKTVTIPEGYIVNNIDELDLNAYKTGVVKSALPRTMFIWCKQPRETGIDGLQLTAPTHLLVAQYDGDKITAINQDIRLDYAPAESAVAQMPNFENIVGGQLVAPLNNGQLAYCYTNSRGYTTSTWHLRPDSTRTYKNTITSYALPISVNGNGNITLAGKQIIYELNRDISFNYGGAGKKRAQKLAEAAGPIWKSINIQNPGAQIDINKNYYNKISIKPWSGFPNITLVAHSDNLSIKYSGSFKDVTSDYSPDKITTKRVVDSDPAHNKLDSYMLQNSASVYAVMYGWPYHAVKEGIVQRTFPTFTQSKNYTLATSEDFSNGCSTSLENGAQKKTPGGPSFKFAVATAYSYNHSQSTDQTQSVNTEFTLEKTDIAMEAGLYANTGVVFYNFNKLIINSAGIFQNESNQSTEIIIPGLSDRAIDKVQFEYIIAGAAAKPEDGVIHTCLFDLGNPSKLTRPDAFMYDEFRGNTYSPLSKGLMPKPSSRIIFDDAYQKADIQLKEIDVFQKTSGFNDLLSRAKQYGKKTIDGKDISVGVIPYIEQGGNKTGKIQYTLDASTSVSCTKSVRQTMTDAHTWSVGKVWEYNGIAGGLTSGEVTYDGSTTYSTSTEGSNGYKITIPGCVMSSSLTMEYYTFYIDIPMLKNILQKAVALKAKDDAGALIKYEKPFYIPDYCWDNNNSFMLMIPFATKKTVDAVDRVAAKEARAASDSNRQVLSILRGVVISAGL